MPFDQAALAKVVQDALATEKAIPVDHRGAFLTVVDDTGVKAIVAHRFNASPNGWIVSAVVEHPWAGGLKEGVTLGKTW